MRNVRDYAIAIIAAIGFISAVVSLLTTRWTEVSGALRVRRTLLISVVLIVTVLAMIVNLPLATTPAKTSGTSGTTVTQVATSSSGTTTGVTTTDTTTTDTTTTVAVTTSAETTTSGETNTIAVTPTVEPVRPPRAVAPVIRDTSGRSVPQLIVAAQRAIDTTRHRVEGTLSSSTAVESDPRLQGMITARLELDVTVTTRGVLTAAFMIQSQGGGFTEAKALQQARERLAVALGERLRQEIQ